MDEITLINECLKDNRIAQEQLYKRFASRMLGVCFRYARSRDEAEDLLQDGFVKVFLHLKKFKGEGSLEGWVRRIMVNTAINYLKKNRIFFEKVEDHEVELENYGSLNNDMDSREIMQEIQKLPSGYKAVFNLFAIEGYSHKEIGEILNIAESTSRSQFTRARFALIKQLENKSTSLKHE